MIGSRFISKLMLETSGTALLLPIVLSARDAVRAIPGKVPPQRGPHPNVRNDRKDAVLRPRDISMNGG